MWRLNAKITVLVISTIGSLVHAGSYGPYVDRRLTDSTGRYYVIIEKAPGWDSDPGVGGPVTFTIAEQNPGSEPVTSERNDLGEPIERFGEWIEIANPNVAVRDGDIQHGSGILDHAPGQILISTAGLGFVALDIYGYSEGRADRVIVVSLDGTIRHRKSLVDLFSEEQIARFEASAGSEGNIPWRFTAWIDEERREVVIVSRRTSSRSDSRLVRVIDWESGEIREGSSDDIVTALAEMNRNALPFAIDLAIEGNLPNTDVYLVAILENEELPLSNRAYAAVELTRIGDQRGVNLIKEYVVTATESSRERSVVIQHLHEIFGVEAAPILQEAARQVSSYDEVFDEFNQIGTAAIPTLIDMVNNDSSPWGQHVAVNCLGDLGPAAAEAVPSLIAYSTGNALTEEQRFMVARTFGEIGSAAIDAAPILEEWERDARADLEAIEEAEALNPPDPYASQVSIARASLREISWALRRIERANQ